ncbi:MAG: AEC family transporter [Anaerolineae bacterium]|jgi:predicted permease
MSGAPLYESGDFARPLSFKTSEPNAVNIASFFQPFVTLFALIALGALVGRLRLLDQHGVSQISSLVINVTLPATIFYSVAMGMSIEMLAAAPLVVVLGVAVGGISYLLGWGIARRSGLAPAQRGVCAFAGGCTNTGFLGIPLVVAVFGPGAGIIAVLCDFATTINIFTFGVAGLAGATGAEGMRCLDVGRLIRGLINPMFLSLIIGVGWSALGWDLPAVPAQLLQRVGDATTPLAMIALGHMLYEAGRGAHAPVVPLGLIGGVRLLAAPLLMLAAVWVLPMTPETRAVCVLQAAMPTAMLTPILARQYGADHRLGLAAAMTTTVTSLVTLPALAYFLYRGLGWG